jgi:nucleoid-associated protein YgaU
MAQVKQSQVTALPNLNDFQFEQIFHVYQEKGKYFYNLLKTVNFPEDMSSGLYTDYVVKAHDLWWTIAHELYG